MRKTQVQKCMHHPLPFNSPVYVHVLQLQNALRSTARPETQQSWELDALGPC